jgi:hypothetical protein
VRVQGQLERASNRPLGQKGAEKTQSRLDGDEIDAKFGFTRFREVQSFLILEWSCDVCSFFRVLHDWAGF